LYLISDRRLGVYGTYQRKVVSVFVQCAPLQLDCKAEGCWRRRVERGTAER
jgi:hypothetical protein